MLRIGLCGGVAVEVDGRRLPDSLLAGRQGRLILAYLLCERHRSVPREELAELVWGDRLPSSWASSLSAVVSKLRRLLTEAGLDGAAALASSFGSYRLHLPDDAWVDVDALARAVERAEQAVRDGQAEAALTAAGEAQDLARRGFLTDDCRWVDTQRDRLRDLHVRAAYAGSQALLLSGDRPRAVAAARDALTLDELREASYRLLMEALAAAGERGEALRVWERCRIMLVEELGTDPAPETEAVYLSILGDPTTAASAPTPAPSVTGLPSGVVTFLLTDIVDSSALWERDAAAMTVALQRHDQMVADVVATHGGVLLKAKLEGDATVSVFWRASAATLAAWALREALTSEPWPPGATPEVRMALHTGEAVERDGDFFGPALNRAARLRSLARGGQILVSQAVAEVVRDHLSDTTGLRSLGEHQLRGMTRAEHVFELTTSDTAEPVSGPSPLNRPPLPAVLATKGPFVGRAAELERLATEWATATAGSARALLIGGEPGVGKTRLAAESARHAYEQGAVVLYGRCDEELGAPYQPFAEALRALVPRVGAARLRSIRGVEELARLAPELIEVIPGLAAPSQADPDTERSLLFDAMARLLAAVSAELPVLVVIDDLHWAAKPTLLLLRHLLRAGDGVRLQILGTYRSTDLDRAHPLAGVLTDLHREGATDRLTLGGLDADDVSAYLSAAGYDDARLGSALSSVTSGNPFFLIEVLRHVEESGGEWHPNTLPQGVREAVSRRLSLLSEPANETLLVGAVVGSQFSLDLVERVLERELLDPIAEASRAGLVVEEPGNRFRFNHALVRQTLLSEVVSVKRIRIHQRVAAALEADPTAAGDAYLAELARHWFECAFAGGAAKAVDYSRRAGEQAMSRLAYEEAADLYNQALVAADVDGSDCRDDERAELLLARCEALLAAGDPNTASVVVEQLQSAARHSPRLSAWAACYAAQLAVLTHPEQLGSIANDVADAARRFADLGDPGGEAKAHTVAASCFHRLGRVADCEAALDRALTAARRAGEPRRVNAVLAGAPLAALWGPSPIARASGRCLDVVRVLRITTGSTAVEAVALRCQAVLEALRGRTDAARRMLGSARRLLESLGHTHGLLEVDLFAGIVELIAGAPADAEVALRRAYDGFVSRGVGVDAAQAAAHLARAVLAQGRIDQAIALTRDSEHLAGVDLQAAIAWHAARAEALAQHGQLAEALESARAAVALADPTDALIDKADAHLALAIVSHLAGQPAGADREARVAAELYERKGATVRVEGTRAVFGPPAVGPSTTPVVHPAVSNEPIGLAGVAGDPSGSPQDYLSNAAHKALVRLFDVWMAGDTAGWASRIRPDAVYDDRRRIVGGRYEGRDGVWSALQSALDIGVSHFDLVPIATRGSRLLLTRTTLRGRDGEVQFFAVNEFDADGLQVGCCMYDLDDLDTAFDELDTRFYAGEAAASVASLRLGVLSAYNNRDWAKYSSGLADGFTVVDHRQLGWGTLDRPSYVATLRSLTDLSSNLRMRAVAVPRFAPRGFVSVMRGDGTDAEGGAFELHRVLLVVVDEEGRATRHEYYDHEDIAAALARFDELMRPLEVGYLTNHATTICSRLLQWRAAGNWDSYASALAEDGVYEDRRRVVGFRADGRDAMLVVARSVADIGVTDTEAFPLATRGNHLALMRLVYRGAQAEAEVLHVAETAPDGKCVGFWVFDPDEIDAALAQLEARYVAGEAATYAETWSRVTAGVAALNARDWEGYAATHTEDFVFVDHRALGLPTMGTAELIANSRALVEVSADSRFQTASVLGLTATGAAHRLQAVGTNGFGGPWGIVANYVALLRDGRCHRMDVFAFDDVEGALRQLHQPSTAEPLSNAATRGIRRIIGAQLAGDWDAVVEATDDGVVLDDRRRIVGGRFEGRDAAVRWARSLNDMGVTYQDAVTLATRGDRLAIRRVIGGGAVGESEVLCVDELAESGRWLATIVFDPDELDGVFEELDARYLAGEGTAYAATLTPMLEFLRAYNRHDFTRCRALLADDFCVVDHRPPPTTYADLDGADEFVAAMNVLFELAADVRARGVTIHPVGDGASVFQLRTTASTPEGADIELAFHLMIATRGGQITRFEFFADDQLAAARARAGELLAASPSAGVSPYLDNAAYRCFTRIWASALAGDWDAFGAQLAADAALDDRRRIVGYRAEGPDAVVESAKSTIGLGATEVATIPLATRGDSLVLLRGLWRGEQGEVEALVLIGVDTDGLLRGGTTIFDPEDLDVAVGELDARYIAGGGARYAATLTPMMEFLRAYNRHDFVRCRALLADDFGVVDHRPAPTPFAGLDGPDEFVAAMDVLLELASGVRARAVTTDPVGDGVSVVQVQATGSTPEGADIELAFHLMIATRDGQITRFEYFGEDQLAAARARADELLTAEHAAPTPAYLDNAATRRSRQILDALVSGDRQAHEAGTAEHVVFNDRRPIFRYRAEGRRAFSEIMTSVYKAGVREIVSKTLATRGDRLALNWRLYRGPDGETEAVNVAEFDADGLEVAVDVFDPEDMDAAYAELDERFAAGEAAASPAAWSVPRRIVDTYNRRDWDGLDTLLGDGFTFVDHRPAGWGVLDRQQYLVTIRGLVELVAETTCRIVAVPGLARRCGVVVLELTGRDEMGGEFEMLFAAIGVVGADDRLAASEWFTVDDLPRALDRLDELTRDDLRPPVVANGPPEVMPIAEMSRRLAEAIVAHDRNGLSTLLAPDVVRVDRRSGRTVEYAGHDEAVTFFSNTTGGAGGRTLATRADHLVLQRERASDPAGAVGSDFLVILATDDAGALRRIVWFDPEETTAAFAELDDLYAGELPAERTSAWRLTQALTDRYNARDRPGLRAVLAEDCVVVDERVTGWGTLDRDTFLDNLQQLVGMAPDASLTCVDVHLMTPDGSVVRYRVTGTVPGGGEFEMLFEGTGVVRDGKFIRLELLPEGRVSDAVSRLADAAGPAASPRASDGDPPSAFDPLS